MDDRGYGAALEAILFLHGEALSVEKLASFLNISSEDVRAACRALAQQYVDDARGLMLLEKNESYQLVTKPAYEDFLSRFIKEGLKEELTPAALETLSLIAYFGPITRAHIDFVRGVNSSFTLRNLLIRGLVERELVRGNMYAYQITFDFLKQLGIRRTSELPKYDTYQPFKEQLVSQQSEQTHEHIKSAEETQQPIASQET